MEKNTVILVVDDEWAFRNILNEILTQEGYQVIEAESGRQAVDIFERQQEHINLVLLDVEMPDMNGYEVLEVIKPCCVQRGIKICFVTAKDTREDVMKAISLGISDYITKPSDKEVIVGKVKKMLEPEETNPKKNSNSVMLNIKAEVTGLPLDLEVKITEISPRGLKFKSPVSLKPNAKIPLKSEELKSMLNLTGNLNCYVLSCVRKGEMYLCNSSFDDLDQEILDKINNLCNL
ncbi:MAG: response regulator [Oligoflexia bacterium]|nr:response regulator [Oligoflexia bacterium]